MRDIRAILESVEAKLDTLLQNAADRQVAPRSSRRFPAPLPQAARDAIDLVLSEATGPITARDLIKAASFYTDTLRQGGPTTHSIRCYLAEKAGMAISWANTPGIGAYSAVTTRRPQQQRDLPLRGQDQDQDDDDGDPA